MSLDWCGEETLHHRVVPPAALRGHAAEGLPGVEQVLVIAGAVLAAFVRIEEPQLPFNAAVAEGPVNGPDHQSRIPRFLPPECQFVSMPSTPLDTVRAWLRPSLLPSQHDGP